MYFTGTLLLLSALLGAQADENFVRINKHLMDSSTSADIKENMDAARAFLHKTQATNSLFQASLVSSLEDFIKLEQSVSPDLACSWQSYQILVANDAATEGRAHQPKMVATFLRRIDPIVHEFFVNHANQCTDKHSDRLEDKMKELDETMLYYVESFMTRLAGQRQESLSGARDSEMVIGSAAYNILLDGISYLGGEIHAKEALDTLKLLAQDDPKVSSISDSSSGEPLFKVRNNIMQLIKSYLVEPCEHYMRALEPVLLPAKFDRATLGMSDVQVSQEDPTAPPSPELRLESALGHYKLCDLLITRDQKSLARNLIRVASRSSTTAG